MDDNETKLSSSQPQQPQQPQYQQPQQPQYQQPQQPQYQQPQYQQPQYQQPQYQQPYQQAYQQPQYQQPYQQQGYGQSKNEGMRLNDFSLYSLAGAAKWIKTIGVIATIMLIIMFILGIILAVVLPKGTGPVGIVFLIEMLIVAGIYLYPIIKSYSVGNNIKQAVALNDEDYLQEGLSSMKSMFTYIGVLAIIGLVFFVIAMIFAVIGLVQAASYSHHYYY